MVGSAATDPDVALLVTAMELLRTAVADLRTSLAATATSYFKAGSGAGGSTDRVSAFDRPQPVVIMGPVPLQVTGAIGKGGPVKPLKQEDAKKGGNIFADLGNMLAAKFSAVLGPLALFGQILSSNAAGFQLVASAMKILAATLAPIFLPVMIVLAAALLDLQEDIMKRVLPALRSWAAFIFGKVLPVLHKMAEMLLAVVDALTSFLRTLGGAGAKAVEAPRAVADDALKAAVDAFKKSGKSFEEFTKEAGLNEDEKKRFREAVDRSTEAEGGAAKIGGFGFGAVMKPRAAERAMTPAEIHWLARGERPAGAPAAPGRDAAGGRRGLDDVIASLKASLSPKASISGFEQVYSKVQLAALNADPIEARMLDTMMKILGELEGARADVRGAPVPVFGEVH